MGSVPTSLGEWIHSPWFDLGLVVWKGYRPRVRLVLAGGHASAWFSPYWRGPAPGAQRYQAALVQILRRLLTPATVTLSGLHDLYLRDNLLALAGHGDGHILTVTVALLLAILTGRSDLCIAGVFGAGKTRSLAVLLIALSCELDDFSAVIYTKENVAAKALADQISDLSPPTLKQFGRLLGRIEEGKGEAYATKIDVRCNDRNRIIASKRILIATGGSATAEMSMRYSNFSQWLSRIWLAWTKVSNMATIMK